MPSGSTWPRRGLGLLLLLASLRMEARAVEGPPADRPLDGGLGIAEDDARLPVAPAMATAARTLTNASLVHEVAAPPADGGARRLPASPPPPRAEGQRPARPSASAEWIDGYWAWDDARGAYAWVEGVWQEPPAGRSWVDGSWRRDAQGWYREPGRWSDHAAARPAWRDSGPPAAPDEPKGPPPGPDRFYIAGHYEPKGSDVVWKAGGWARVQRGWSWQPASWVQDADGWDFQPGRWARAPQVEPASLASASISRAAARPVLPDALPQGEPASGQAAEVAAMPVVTGPPPALVAWTDQLAGQVEGFLAGMAPRSRLVPQGGAFMGDALALRQSANALRWGLANGADVGQLRMAFIQADGAYRRLASRTQRIGRGRTGPNIQLVWDMGFSFDQIRLLLP